MVSARPANEPVAQQPSRRASGCDAAFEQRGKAAGDQLGMVARHRQRARRASRRTSPARHGPPDCPRARSPAAARALASSSKSSNAITPSGRSAAEAADMADRKDVGRDLHRHRAGVEVADARRGDDGFGAEPAERACGVGAPPQQRQRRRDHAGAQHAKNASARSRRCWGAGCRRSRRSAARACAAATAIAETMRSVSA